MNPLTTTVGHGFRRTHEPRMAVTSLLVDWTYGPVNGYVQTAIHRYLMTHPGIISAGFPELDNRLQIEYDPTTITQAGIIQALECPQIALSKPAETND